MRQGWPGPEFHARVDLEVHPAMLPSTMGDPRVLFEQGCAGAANRLAVGGLLDDGLRRHRRNSARRRSAMKANPDPQ